MRPHLIVNPAAADGKTGRHFDAVLRALRNGVGEFDCSFTRRRGDGARLAYEAARGGAHLVVAVGGDGTASEVIDGLFTGGELVSDVTFGFIPRGTGGDLSRTLAWPADPVAATRILCQGDVRPIDVGRIEFVDVNGRPRIRHFANVAGLGVSGHVVRVIERGGKGLGGRTAFMLASARALLGWRDQPVRWRLDHGPWREDRVTSICVCNGRFFGGGMMVAPQACVDDGLFDVTVWQGLGLSDFMLKRGMLYDGTHVRLPNTRTFRARVLEAEPVGVPVLLDVDGEQPGMLPARFSLLPRALPALVAPLGA